MKLSKSKLALAKVINENGGWVDDSVYAANDECGNICGYSSKPIRRKITSYYWSGSQRETWIRGIKTPQWHQCILSREEYYHAHPKADADGWIEWNGGECPVEKGLMVDIRVRDGREERSLAANTLTKGRIPDASCAFWKNDGMAGDIIAYRLHKPEVKPEFCESVMRSIPEPEFDDAGSRLAKALELVKSAAPHMLRDKYKFDGNEVMGERKPTIEQLAQDYRNAKDYADRLQKEAYEAKAAADAALGELERAGEALGLVVTQVREDRTPNPIIADFRHLKIGDAVRIVRDNIGGRYNGYEGHVAMIDPDDTRTPVLVNLSFGTMWCHEVEFIR